MKQRKIYRIAKWVLPIVLFLIISCDGITHWDETNFLYKAAYAPMKTGEHWLQVPFYRSRLIHIVMLKTLFNIVGKGIIGWFLVETLMAFLILGAGVLFYLTLTRIFKSRKELYSVFLSFLFLPVALYLGYKSLGETTAIFFSSLAIYLFVLSRRRYIKNSIFFLFLSSLSLFIAANCREAALLSFFGFIFPLVIILPGNTVNRITRVALVGIFWCCLYGIFGGIFDIWSLNHIIHGGFQGGTAKQLSVDLADYPSNHIQLFLAGGSFWLLIIAALARWKSRLTWIGISSFCISVLPLVVVAPHLEIRYLGPGIFGFALLSGIGLESLCGFRKRIFPRLPDGLIAALVLLLAVGVNQIIRPLYEEGTSGFTLLELTRGVFKKYEDPLIIMSHPHSTYSFLRICYPEKRIALDRTFYGHTPLTVLNPSDIRGIEDPWLYLTPRGERARSFLTRLIHFIKGYERPAKSREEIPKDSWVTRSEEFQFEPEGRSNNYLIYRVSLVE